MTVKTTVGQFLINQKLPEPLRDYDRVLNKKNLGVLLKDIATKYPTQYKEILMGFKDIGQRTSYLKGSGLGIKDFDPPIDYKSILDKEVAKIPSSATDAVVVDKFAEIQKKIENRTMDAAMKKGNIMAFQIASGARGSPAQLASTITTPTLYADNMGKPIRVPIRHSFSEGLDPVEYFAGTYGTRAGVISTKMATPEGGFFGKQLGYISGNMLITEEDCNTDNGTDTDITDSENIGRLLARQTGRYPKNTILTPEIISDLKKQNINKIIIRSPLSCESDEGMCQKCRGFTEQGTIPALGENVGSNTSAALSESATQGAMNVKHTGGQVASAKKSGLELIKQLMKVPKIFRGGAVVSELDGNIGKIYKAPQGGYNVEVGNVNHYVLPGYDILVKQGDTIEAGQPLSSGIINPADVTRLRGIGEGRRFLSDSLRTAFLNDGSKVNKVHMESMARSAINHAKVADNTFIDDYVPGDVATITAIQKHYNPIGKEADVEKTNGKFLAKPYMHLNAGTMIKPSIIKLLKENGINKIKITDEEPPFDPVMIRLDDVPAYKDNWVARLFSTQIKKKLLGATHKSESAPIHSTEFIPSYITATEFGKPKIHY